MTFLTLKRDCLDVPFELLKTGESYTSEGYTSGFQIKNGDFEWIYLP